MNDKRKRMVLKSEDMPDLVYDILDKKSQNRSLTPFIIQLVENYLNSEKIENKLESIENKLDSFLSDNFKFIERKEKNYFVELAEDSLKEGKLIEAEKVIGEIDPDDLKECDF